MNASRPALIAILFLILLAACAGPTPTALPSATPPAPLVTPSQPAGPTPNPPAPNATATPESALPSPTPTVASPFPQGLTNEPLSVVTTQPADKADEVTVTKDSTRIIVQFNHPVVPLVSVDAQKNLPQPLTIQPALGGSGEWINTSTYAFTPSQNLTVATQYTVTVSPLKDMLGQALNSYSWSFKTSSPAVIKTYPADNTKFAGPSEPITMTFNTDMDRASTEARFSLTNKTTNAAVTGHFEWQGTVLHFVPDQALAYDTPYSATLKAGAQDASGRVAATVKDVSWTFRTAAAPAVLSTNPANGDASSLAIRDGFQITFSSPMDQDSLQASVSPTITNQSIYWEFDRNDTVARISGNWLASRSYTVTISGGSKTRYGEALGHDVVVHFTAAPLDPALSLNANGIMGMYDVNVPQVLYSSFTNINRIDYKLYKVPRADLLQLMGTKRFDFWDKYQPVAANKLREWSQTVQAPLNASGLISTTLTTGTPLSSGVYYLEASSPTVAANGDKPARQILIVSGINLALKSTTREGLVWVTDLKTGKPVANQPLNFYSPSATLMASSTTDADGVARVQFTRPNAYDAIYVLSETDSGVVAAVGSDWNEGINTYDYNLPSQPEAQEFYANLYTDRAIYRPGQSVYFKGILRRDNDARYTLPTDASGETVPISVRDDQGKEIFKGSLPLSRFGTFNGEVKLSDSASIGFYNLSLELGQEPNKFFSSVGFQVAEYRAPEFQVAVTSDKPEYINGDTIKADVNSTYFFGGAVADANVTWRLLSDDLFFQPENVKGFWDFIDYDLTTDRRRQGDVITQGKGKTDASGKFHFEVPADVRDFPLSQNFTLESEITDISGNQSVSNRVAVPVHKGNFYIGLRPQRYVGNVGEEQAIDVITVDTKGTAAPNQGLTISFFEHKWYSVHQKNADGNFYWTSAYTDTLVSKVDVKTDAQGAATAKFTPTNGGVYKIVADGLDARGNQIHSATYEWVSGTQFVNWRIENNDRIDLVADKKQYAPGDTADILIPAPFQDAEALMTIERGTIREVKRLTLHGNSERVKIPITDDYAPNVFVSVIMVKGRTADSPTPQFKLAYTNLAVSTVAQEMKIKITPDRSASGDATLAKYAPGDKASFNIEATDSGGKPVEAEFSVAVVDKAIQSLATDQSQSPLQAFYGQRGLGVQTAATLVRSVERINQQLRAEAKGGGGGGLAEQPVRRNFQDTAFWKADVVTDSSGRAQVSVPLPDNLTTWNLTAKGVTAQTLVGMAQSDIVSTKDLLVRPVTPRLFVVGDKALLEAVVNNNTDKDVSADVRLDAQGLTLGGNAQQALTIKAHDKAKVSWQTVVNPEDNVVVTFSANGGSLQDAIQQTIPILRPISSETVATAGQVDTKTAEQIQVPADADRTAGELQLELSPSLAAASRTSLDYLQAYEYESSAETVSKFLPNVATYQALKKLGIDRPDLQKALELNVSRQVQRLYSLQHQDGGWGWWFNDDSRPNITAYALLGLYDAKQAGFAIDQDVMNRAEQFLVDYLNKPVDVKANYRYNERAFVIFTLTEIGRNYTSRAISLFDQRANLDNFGKAFLLMALQKSKAQQAQPLEAELSSAAILSATGTHWQEASVDYWNMNTDTRSTAIIIMALSRADPKNATLADAIRWLMVQRQNGHWETTQETAWSVLGLTEYMLATGELQGNYSYQVTVDGKQIGGGTVDKTNVDQPQHLSVAIKDLVRATANDLVISRDSNNGKLYYSAYLQYFLPADKIQPQNKGIIVGRQYFAVDQASLKPTDRAIQSANVGDYVQVKLTIIAPTDLSYLALEDPLPAGFEAVDTTLKTSSVAASSPNIKEQPTKEVSQVYDLYYRPYYSYWAESEVHDNRVSAFATFLRRGTYEYTYTMRASVAGEFHALPARAWEMYFPEVFGNSTGALFSVSGE